MTAEGRAGVSRLWGEFEQPGIRKGLIAELEKATASVQRAAEQAEAMAGCNIESAVVSIGGAHVKGLNSRGGILLGSRQHEITREDVRAAVERARSIQLPNDRQVLHLLPQEFIIDEQSGIQDPLGMTGMRLECNLHIVTASASAVQSVITAVNKAGIEVADTVFDGVASAEALAGVGRIGARAGMLRDRHRRGLDGDRGVLRRRDRAYGRGGHRGRALHQRRGDRLEDGAGGCGAAEM